MNLSSDKLHKLLNTRFLQFYYSINHAIVKCNCQLQSTRRRATFKSYCATAETPQICSRPSRFVWKSMGQNADKTHCTYFYLAILLLHNEARLFMKYHLIFLALVIAQDMFKTSDITVGDSTT